MKLLLIFSLVTLVVASVCTCNAFTVVSLSSSVSTVCVSTASSLSTSLHLFGGGNKAAADGSNGGDKKAPGMMDQLAMFKKAQEMAQKKQKLDAELQKEVFIGVSDEDNKNVVITMKFIPGTNPMDPNPDYEATSIVFKEDWYQSASTDEISMAVKTAIMDGTEKTNVAVAQKYAILQEDLMAAFGQAGSKQ